LDVRVSGGSKSQELIQAKRGNQVTPFLRTVQNAKRKSHGCLRTLSVYRGIWKNFTINFLRIQKSERTVPEMLLNQSHWVCFLQKKEEKFSTSTKKRKKGETLLANWIATSLRPFSIVEGPGFRDFVDFLCNLNKQFSIPGRKKVRNQLESFESLLITHVK